MIPTAVLAAQYAGTFDLFDTTTLTARTTQPEPQVAEGDRLKKVVFGTDFATVATARLTLVGHRFTYSLAYTPSFTVTDLELGNAPQIYQSALANVTWHDRFLRVTASEAVSYGTTFIFNQAVAPIQTAVGTPTTPAATPPTGSPVPPTTTTLPGGTTPVQTPAPVVDTVEYYSSVTSAGAALRVSPRTSLSAAAAYFTSGGVDARSRAIFPEQWSPSGTVALSYAPTRRDSITLSANASFTHTEGSCQAIGSPLVTGVGAGNVNVNGNGQTFCVEDVPYATAQATLFHQISARASMSIGGGAGVTVVTPPTVRETVIIPVGSAAVSYRPGAQATDLYGLSTILSPYVDIRTGVASYRWQTAASVFHAISQTVGLVFSGGVVKSIPFPLLFSVRPGASFPADPYPITAVDGGVESRISLPQHRAASIGTRVLYQDQAGFTPVASWTGYGQLSVTPFVAVGAGLLVFWQSASSYATIVGQQTIPAQSSESGFVSLTVRMQSLRF